MRSLRGLIHALLRIRLAFLVSFDAVQCFQVVNDLRAQGQVRSVRSGVRYRHQNQEFSTC